MIKGLYRFRVRFITSTAARHVVVNLTKPASISRFPLRCFSLQQLDNNEENKEDGEDIFYHKKFSRLATEIMASIGDLSNYELVATVWYYALGNEHASPIFDTVEMQVNIRDLNTFSPRELSNLLWAYSYAGRTTSSVYESVEEHLKIRKLDKFNRVALSRLAWSLAVADKCDSFLFYSIEAQIKSKITKETFSQVKLETLSRFAWAFAKCNKKSVIFSLIESELCHDDSEHGERMLIRKEQLHDLKFAFEKIGTKEHSKALKWIDNKLESLM